MSDDAKSRSVAQGMARLKELLFDTEVETLSQLDQRLGSIEEVNQKQSRDQLEALRRIEQLFERAGTEERFRSSVANVLDKALHEAELRNHDELSRAMAPLVVKTIKTELKNSQDELVDIMAPITGRMVKAYVASEIKKLSDEVNGRIDRNPVMLRVRSIATGKPVSDLAIAQSQHLKVDEIFLIRRGSGELIAHWPDNGRSMSNEDIHMSGVLSAINDFASSAFENDGGSIESFRLSGAEVYMRASPAYLLAARCNGVAPSGIESIFNEEFVATLERVAAVERAAEVDKPVSAQTRTKELLPLAQSVETRTGQIYDDIERSSIGGAIMKALLFLIAVPMLVWFFWGLYTNAEEALVRRSAQHVVDNTPGLRGYQTNIDVGYRGHSLIVSGLVPDQSTATQLTAALGRELPGTKLDARLAAIPTAPVVAPQTVDTQALERRLAERVARAERQLVDASVRRDVARAQLRLRQAVPEFDTLETQLKDDAQKADLREARAALQKAVTDVSTLRSVLVDLDDQRDLKPIVARVNSLSNEVGDTISSLAALHGQSVRPGRSTLPANAGLSDVTADLASQSERLATLAIALNQTAAMIPAPVVVLPTPEEQLIAFVAAHAVFFENGVDFLSKQDTAKTLDEAAQLMKPVDRLVRVAGYTDEQGGSGRNEALAQNRARLVVDELVRRGVPAERLVAIGRVDRYPLSPGAGAASPNRRVQFELGFRGEKRGQASP